MKSRPNKQLIGLLLTLAFVLVPLAALGTGAAAAQSPAPPLRVNGRIAFTHLENFSDGEDIYTVNPDGTGRTPLVSLYSHQQDPAWSPDGKYLAYASGQNGYGEIWRVDANGSNPMSLSDGVAVRAVDDYPAWSPDGQKIVFVRNRQLWTVGKDGGAAVKLSAGSDEDEQPAWSPDGTKIVFVRNYSSATAQIWVMDADGTNQRNLSNYEWGFSRYPAWSPDGGKIAFQRWNDIWVMDADGANQTQITFAARGGYSKPSWSPDGTQIVVTNGMNYDGEIFVMNADGSNITKITDGVHPTWQPLPALAMTTVHWPDPVVPGAELSYALTVTNNHALTATGATLTDTLDAGTTFVSATASKGSCATPAAGETGTLTCSLGDLVRGEQATVTLVVRVTAGGGTTLHNTATAAADYAGHGRQTESADTPTQVAAPTADLIVSPWVNEGLYTAAGGQVVYAVGVFNFGPAPAEGVTLTGQMPAGVTIDSITNDGGSCAAAADNSNFTCTFPTLGFYEGQNVTVTATSNASGAPYTPLTATFNVAGTTPDHSPVNNAAVADFYIAAPPLPAPTPGPSNDGLLAYSKQTLSTGLSDVFRQRADGAETVNLTDDDPSAEGFFVWSPDGSRLAFLRHDYVSQTTSLGTVAADGSGRTLLVSVPGEYIGDCSWSPDGARLVFSARGDAFDTQTVNDVFVINADGTGRSNLTNGDGFNFRPSWSPDGARISYARAVYGPQGIVSTDIRVVGVDGSGGIQIPQAAGERDSYPRWSPDGSRLAFTRRLADGSTGLYTARPDGADLRALTNDAAVSDTHLEWSPDGSKLSYSFSRDDGTSKLEVINADGTGRTTVYEPPADGTSYDIGSAKWSPDGTRLVFDVCYDGCFRQSIYVARADGTGRIELGNGAEQNSRADWSPDGTRLAFVTSRNGDNRINIINADGAGRVELPGEAGYHGAPRWQPRKAGDTPAGENVTVAENGVAVNFSNVTTAGVTTVTPIDPNSLQGIPGEYVVDGGTLAFEIQTTAVYAGPITIGFQVPGVSDPAAFDALRVLHGEPAPNFIDRTVLAPDSPAPDFAARTLYARVTSLSPFVVARKSPRYGVRTLYDETKTHKSGSTVPVKLQLTDAAGANVSSPSLVVKALGTTRVSTNASGTLEDAGNSNPDFDFRYDASLGGYIFNLKTKGYAPGTYSLAFRVAGDPGTHAVQFRVTK